MSDVTQKDLAALRADIAATYATRKDLEEVRNLTFKAERALASLEARLDAIGESLKKMEGNISWGVKAVLGIVIAALVALVFK